MFRKRFRPLLLVTCGGLLIAFGARHTPAAAIHEVTFTQSVAPIFYKHCAACHHEGGIGPMPLVAYAQAKPFSALIRDRVVKGIMPPWFANAPLGEFSNDPRLTATEIHTIAAWVDEGSPEGNPKDLPPQPRFSGSWFGSRRPDAVFSMAEPYTVPAHGQGVYAYFKIPTHFKEDKWVTMFQILPGNRRVVHHATLGITVPVFRAKSRKSGKPHQDPDAKYIYEAAGLHYVRMDAPVVNDGCSTRSGGEFPGEKTTWEDQGGPGDFGNIGVYLPGRPVERLRPGYALRIPAGAVLHLGMHYMPMGKPETDRTRIGFWFTDGPIKAKVERVDIPNMLFEIPAGDSDLRQTTCYTFPVAVDILSYTIHMHYRGKSATVYAVYPNGKRETLLSVPHYNFDWQLKYILSHPKPIPKGTVIKTVYHDDNSRANPLNPDPTKTIRWGEPSDSEMTETIMEFIVATKKAPALSARR
ncbi:MAG: c-type cytochrome [Terriglobia bacterium]